MLKKPVIRKTNGVWSIISPAFGLSSTERITPCRSFKHAVYLSTGAGGADKNKDGEQTDNATSEDDEVDLSKLVDMLGHFLPLTIEPKESEES